MGRAPARSRRDARGLRRASAATSMDRPGDPDTHTGTASPRSAPGGLHQHGIDTQTHATSTHGGARTAMRTSAKGPLQPASVRSPRRINPARPLPKQAGSRKDETETLRVGTLAFSQETCDEARWFSDRELAMALRRVRTGLGTKYNPDIVLCSAACFWTETPLPQRASEPLPPSVRDMIHQAAGCPVLAEWPGRDDGPS